MIKYYTAKYKFCWASQREAPWYLFWVLQGDAKFAKSSDDWSQLQMQYMTHPMWLWYMRMNYSFGAQSSFGSAEYSKKSTHPLIFFRGLGPFIKSINAQQNM